jgi:hypothetical protein
MLTTQNEVHDRLVRLFLGLLFDPEVGSGMLFRNIGGLLLQKVARFIVTAART